jgi:hypothetical protein
MVMKTWVVKTFVVLPIGALIDLAEGSIPRRQFAHCGALPSISFDLRVSIRISAEIIIEIVWQ